MRKVLAAMMALGLVMAGCGDDDAVSEPTNSITTLATTVATSTTLTSTTTSTTTTLAPTTTMSQEQQDAAFGAALWDGLTWAWVEGPAAAARYIEANTYPGWPAVYEDCLMADRPAGWRQYVPMPDTIEPDPGWGSSDIAVEVQGRIYTMDVEVWSGVGGEEEQSTNTSHISVLGDDVFFFFVCEPALAEDALAYRLDEGATYTHKVTFRSNITEDQSPAGGRQRTGREDWTIFRTFEVTQAGERDARVEMEIDRVIWEIASTVGNHTHGASLDSDVNTDHGEPPGPLADVIGFRATLNLYPDGPGSLPPLHRRRTSFSLIDLPVSAVTEGDSWVSDWGLDKPALLGTVTVTVTSIDDEQVWVALEGTGTGSKTYLEVPLARYELVTAASVSGTAVIDRATGWVQSVDVDIEAEGTIEFTTQGVWMGLRPLFSQDDLDIGVEMPTTYTIRIETRTVEG